MKWRTCDHAGKVPHPRYVLRMSTYRLPLQGWCVWTRDPPGRNPGGERGGRGTNDVVTGWDNGDGCSPGGSDIWLLDATGGRRTTVLAEKYIRPINRSALLLGHPLDHEDVWPKKAVGCAKSIRAVGSRLGPHGQRVKKCRASHRLVHSPAYIAARLFTPCRCVCRATLLLRPANPRTTDMRGAAIALW